MAIIRLALTDFRNHARLTLHAGPGLNILTGENGAGKTNILEAISLFAPGRGLRSASFADMARIGGAGAFGVAANLKVDCDGIALATGISADRPGRRLARINGATAASGGFAEWLAPIWLTPLMDRIFVEGASERRRFLDRLVLARDPGHARHASRYDAALRQRNRLLCGVEPVDPAWLRAVEAQMAEHGLALDAGRARLLAELNPTLAARGDPDFPEAQLEIGGWRPGADFATDLANSRPREIAAGRTLIGPHRSDLVVIHKVKMMAAASCSTGEQKALLIGILLAHADLVAADTGRRPLLLLDEIAAHLDPRRRAALFARLIAGGGQVWMTGTDLGPFEGLGQTAHRFEIGTRD